MDREGYLEERKELKEKEAGRQVGVEAQGY